MNQENFNRNNNNNNNINENNFMKSMLPSITPEVNLIIITYIYFSEKSNTQ